MLFARLGVWADTVPRGGPAQMAADEAMLAAAAQPVLRVFHWSGPWVSAGCFIPYDDAAAVRPDLPVCRRWTAGGIVVHDGDLTFSLAVPRGERWAALRAAESYRELHQAVARAMTAAGLAVELAAGSPAPHGECFARPVTHDILRDGTKVAGGAQRRTRRGVLHQGSIQRVPEPGALAGPLAEAMAETVEPWSPPADIEETIMELVARRYGRPDFLRRGVAGE
jgi:lipoate-protein ligase A